MLCHPCVTFGRQIHILALTYFRLGMQVDVQARISKIR